MVSEIPYSQSRKLKVGGIVNSAPVSTDVTHFESGGL